MLLLVHQLFHHHPDVLERWRARFNYLLVDEYQDTNRVQYLLLRALAAGKDNICVVGDEDQSIYRWRGADIHNILEFEHDFPAARIFKLEQNYRSTKTILAAAHTVIVNNHERKEKQLWTENEPGDPVTCYTATTERDEADFIGREIAQLCQDLFKPSDVVVFYRTNAQSRVIEEALVRRRIPLLCGRRTALLRPARNQGPAGVFARSVQSGRRSQPDPIDWHPAARYRRPQYRGDGRDGWARADEPVRHAGPGRDGIVDRTAYLAPDNRTA